MLQMMSAGEEAIVGVGRPITGDGNERRDLVNLLKSSHWAD